MAPQTAAMVSAAGELRKQNVLDFASAPWEATKLRPALPLVPAQNITLEEAEQHVNVLAVRAFQTSPLVQPACSSSGSLTLSATPVYSIHSYMHPSPANT